MKRFYKETAVDRAANGDATPGWRVLLDGRPMRTPAKSVLVVPTEALAEAIAEEWRGVPEGSELNVSQLALTRLAATGLDRVASKRGKVIEDTAKYGASDLLCYRATEPTTLVERQARLWQPLLDWLAQYMVLDVAKLPIRNIPPDWAIAKNKEFMDRYLRLARR